MSTSFPLGKLPADVLARLLAKVRPVDPRVLVGPGIGLDAAVTPLKGVLGTDSIGWYAVQVNANDIATTGATPCWFLATVLLLAGSAASGTRELPHFQRDEIARLSTPSGLFE